jgi:hypothetical protein
VGQTRGPLGEANSFLYFRSNATGWGVDNATRLSQTSSPNVFGRLYSVTESWMITDRDTAIVTETNAFNAWGTSQKFYGASDKLLLVPGQDPLTLQPPGGDAHFKVKYATLGQHRVLVDINPALLSPPQSPIITIQACGSAVAIDQQQPTIDATVGSLAIGGASQQRLAQVVTTGVSGSLVAVRLPVACDAGSNLVVQIQSVDDTTPTGVVLTSQTISGATLPPTNPPIFRNLAFANPVSFVAGDEFAIVVSSAGSCAISQGPAADSYPGGEAFFESLPNPPGWVPLTPPRLDLPFQTSVQGNACAQ